jgi:hypothetical protein
MSYAPRPIARRAFAALGLAAALAAPAAGQVTIYNSNGFEPPAGTGYGPGALTGQHGYQVLGSSAATTVQSGVVFSGTQAVQINGPSLIDTGSQWGHTNFWWKAYNWDPGQQLVSQLGTPYVQVGFKVWTQNLINPGNDIPLAGVYLEGWKQGSIGFPGPPFNDQRAISPIMVNGVNGITVFTSQAIGGSTMALRTEDNQLPREQWNELYAEFNFQNQTFRVYRVGQTGPLAFTRDGGGILVDSDPGTPGFQPYIDVPFRNSNLAPGHPNYNTVSLAEIGILASMGTIDGQSIFSPGNNMYIDDFWVTRSGSSLPPPVPEPGFVLAAVGLAGLAGWRLRRRGGGQKS